MAKPSDGLSLATGNCLGKAVLERVRYSELRKNGLALIYPCLTPTEQAGIALKFMFQLLCQMDDLPSPPVKVLIYPATPDVQGLFLKCEVTVKTLTKVMSDIRVRAYQTGKRIPRYPSWERRLEKMKRRAKAADTDCFPVHDFFPAVHLSKNGNMRHFASRDYFGRDDFLDPSIYFAQRIEDVLTSGPWDIAIICPDSNVSRPERRRFSQHGSKIDARIKAYMFESPFSYGIRDVLSQGIDLEWIIPEEFRGSCLAEQEKDVIGLFGPQTIAVREVQSPLTATDQERLDENLAKVRELISRCGDPVKSLYVQIRNLYRTFLAMPVPVEYFDRVAQDGYGTPDSKGYLDELDSLCREIFSDSAVASSALQDCLIVLGSILENLRKQPDRAEHILQEVESGINHSQSVGIIVQGRQFSQALNLYLCDRLNTDYRDLGAVGIRIITPQDFFRVKPSDRYVFFGYRTRTVLRYVLSGRVAYATLLLTRPEAQMLSDDLETVIHYGKRWKQTSGQSEIFDPTRRMIALLDVVTKASGGGRSSRFIHTEEELILQWLQDRRVFQRATSQTTIEKSKDCIRVHFADGTSSYFPPAMPVTVLGKKGPSSTEREAANLNPSDKVVFVRGTQRDSIYELMLEEFKKSPLLRADAIILERWQKLVKEAFIAASFSYRELHLRLKAEGCSIVSSMTVAGWIRGAVMGPQDLGNINLLASALKICQPSSEMLEAVKTSLRNLRKAHRGFARIVNRLILNIAAHTIPTWEEQKVLDKYLLSVDDIIEAVTVKEVADVGQDVEGIPIRLVGVILAE